MIIKINQMINVKTTVNMCSIVVNMCSIVVNVCRIVVSTPRGVSDLHSLNDLPVVVSGLGIFVLSVVNGSDLIRCQLYSYERT